MGGAETFPKKKEGERSVTRLASFLGFPSCPMPPRAIDLERGEGKDRGWNISSPREETRENSGKVAVLLFWEQKTNAWGRLLKARVVWPPPLLCAFSCRRRLGRNN